MATVNVSTTYAIVPDAKTIAGYQAALAALYTAGAPSATQVSFTSDGDLRVTISDRAAITVMSRWVEAQMAKRL